MIFITLILCIIVFTTRPPPTRRPAPSVIRNRPAQRPVTESPFEQQQPQQSVTRRPAPPVIRGQQITTTQRPIFNTNNGGFGIPQNAIQNVDSQGSNVLGKN